MDSKLQHETKVFELHQLKGATDRFSDKKLIGQGASGMVYMGEHEGQPIAVKRLYKDRGLDNIEFYNERTNLMRACHPNIVRLVGYCHDIQHELQEQGGEYICVEIWERLLCFEYFPRGTLANCLYDESNSFGWHTRCKIIKGICMGVKYLHDIKIWHLDLKPANIFLDKDMTPKIGDFGLSRFTDSTETCNTEDVKGTIGYMTKEHLHEHVISKESDIFSLGVVIIKIIAGPEANGRRHGMSPEDFIDHLLRNWREREQETMLSYIQTCIEIALRCGEDERTKRPTITEIVDELNNIDIGGVQMDPPTAYSSSYTGFKQQPVVYHGIAKLHDPLRGVPVYVMLPSNTVDANGMLLPTLALRRNLEALREVGVAGVVVEVWWGVVERDGPKQYNWKAYVELVQMVDSVGLRMKMALSFHQCKIGDLIIIPLPPWVVKEMDANQNMTYMDAAAAADKATDAVVAAATAADVATTTNQAAANVQDRQKYEYISLGCDMEPVLQGRTPMQVYTNYMHRFRDQFCNYLGKDKVIVEIQVGMGPDGQLMYPSYSTANGWYFPGIGEFQCYDRYMNKSLQKAAEVREKPEWARAGGPTGAGTYNESPENTKFFHKDGEWKDDYGRFFLSWYSRKLLKHGDRLLAAAVYVFRSSSDVTLSAKVSGIHWHYETSSHAAELTAGYYNTRDRDGYLPIIQMLQKHGAVLNLSCVEMRDYEQPAQANSSPETLVKQVGEVAKKANVLLLGENALPRYDEYAFSQVVDTAARIGMSAFTYQRLSEKMFQPDNWRRFVEFVKDMSEISANAP